MSTESRQQFAVVRDIAAPAARVWHVIGTPSEMVRWIPMCLAAHWSHPGGRDVPGVGSIRHIVLPGGMIADEKMLEWDEGRSLRYGFARTNLPFDKVTRGYYGIQAVEPLAEGRSRLTWSIHFESPGALALLRPAVRAGLHAFIGVMASRVKKVAEARAAC